MESSDEKLHFRIEQSKINEAREAAKKKAKELEAARRVTAGGPGGADGGPGGPGGPAPMVVTDNEPAKPMGGVPVPEVDYGQTSFSAAMPGRGMSVGFEDF